MEVDDERSNILSCSMCPKTWPDDVETRIGSRNHQVLQAIESVHRLEEADLRVRRVQYENRKFGGWSRQNLRGEKRWRKKAEGPEGCGKAGE
jgi:hypothetical protein